MDSSGVEGPSAPLENTDIDLTVDSAGAGIRLDQLLARVLSEHSRARIGQVIKTGYILVNGQPKKNSYKLKAGDRVTGGIPDKPPLSVEPEAIDFPVLYEDNVLLVLCKPPGLVVHPGPGNHSGTLVNGLVHYCQAISGVGDAVRPGIVHRLDKDTSGLMVVAKDERVHASLVNIFKSREIEKEYTALIHGTPGSSAGRLVAPIGRHPVNRQKMAVNEVNGRYAATSWRVVREYDGNYSRLQIIIETGRTHQIRVHMAHLGHPVAGDTLYGPGRDNSLFPRQMLHASRLSFNHPVSGEELTFHAPLWKDMELICQHLENEGVPGGNR